MELDKVKAAVDTAAVKSDLMGKKAAKIISYLLLCIGIALSNRCGLPIIPTDLFPRELADITKIRYSRIKVSYDVICLAITGVMTVLLLGHLDGLGIGTILAAFTMGKVIGWLSIVCSFLICTLIFCSESFDLLLSEKCFRIERYRHHTMQLLLPASFGYCFEASRQTQISIDLLPLQAYSTQISIEYETYSVFETILHKLQNEYVH